MNERTEAFILANRLLDEPNADPDDDLRILARQLLRKTEVVERLEKRLQEQQDPTLDMIHANIEITLHKYEEAVRRMGKEIDYVAGSLEQSDHPPPIVLHDLIDHLRTANKVREAVNQFHPMHGESWCGWPPQ